MSQWKLIVTCFVLPYLISCTENKYTNFPVFRSYQNENHRYIFSNKSSGFFIGNSHMVNKLKEEGWYVDNICYLKDYRIFLNWHSVNRDSVLEFRYYPFELIRRYSTEFQETFTLLDSINCLWWELEFPDSAKNLQLELLFNHDDRARSMVLSSEKHQILVPPSVFSSTNNRDKPLWLGASMYWENNDKAQVLCVVDKDTTTIKTALDSYFTNRNDLREKWSNRLKNLLKKNQVYTNLPEITDAVSWAQISLDALFTEWGEYGIKAGLPQPFQNLGRETFISFTSALLIPGRFQDAKSILQLYADYQLIDENNKFYGRIPSHLYKKNLGYKSADVTWWYIKSVFEYLLYTADLSYAEKIFPVIKDAITGALRHRVDKNFFIIHSDGETWMNNGNAPSRGNRAVEIQILWYTSLQIGAYIAQLTHHDNLSEYWLAIANTLRENFQKYFWNSYNFHIYDFLYPDGSHDKKVRPNQIFAVNLTKLPDIQDIISFEAQGHIANTVLTKLTYYFGVSTLWQKDKDFIPCYYLDTLEEQSSPLYNGMVWNWLTGPVISGLLTLHHSDLAFELFFNQGKQILEEYAIANSGKWPREWLIKNKCDTDRIGTISYASTLAEFISNFYTDFMGYQPMALDSTIYLTPRLTEELRYISAILPYKQAKFQYELLFNADESDYTIIISRILGDEPFRIKIQIPGLDPVHFYFNKQNTSHSFRFNLDFRRSIKILPQLDWHIAHPEAEG